MFRFPRIFPKTINPRPYSFVRFNFNDLPEDYHSSYPFSPHHRYIYIAEIPNMPGHCIVMDDKGKHYVGYHTDNFIELIDNELDTYPPVGYKYNP